MEDIIKRVEIGYFEGVNGLVASNIAKPQEFSHIENARMKTIGTIEKREGIALIGNSYTSADNLDLFYFDNDQVTTSVSAGLYRVSTIGVETRIKYLDTGSVWRNMSDADSTNLNDSIHSHTFADGCCFLVNGNADNRYIDSDGITVKKSSVVNDSHLYYSPDAHKINYYKDRLYLADYTVGTKRHKNSVMMSSNPLGIVALVDGDHASGSVTVKVTDVKYFHASTKYEIYRGDTQIGGTMTVLSKTEDSVTFTAGTLALKSSDEIWLESSYDGTRYHQWAENPSSGSPVKQYDTFKVAGAKNSRIKMMVNIGDVMVISNNDNLSIWNDYNLQNFDSNIGCVSDEGYVVSEGALWFTHYTGIYAMTGTSAPKLMSAKVEKYIKGATKSGMEATACGRKGYSVFFCIGDVTLYNPDGSAEYVPGTTTVKTVDDVCLEYNMRTENWYVHTGVKATAMRTYVTSTDTDKLVFCSTESKKPILEFLTGETDNNGTSEKGIPMRIDLNGITLAKQFEKISNPLKMIVESEMGSGIKTFVSLDNDKYYELAGESIKGCSITEFSNKDNDRSEAPRCRILNISLRDMTNKRCKISRVAVMFKETSEEENERMYNYNK